MNQACIIIMNESRSSVLVVDDNVDILEEIVIFLENNNLFIYSYTSAKEALDHLQHGMIHPDIIISDIVMPGMDGYEFFKEVSRNSDLHHIPFIFLSAKKGDDEIRLGKILGADDYITKPFLPEDLLASIQGKLNRKKGIIEISNTLLKRGIPKGGPLLDEHLLLILVKWDDKQGPVIDAFHPEDVRDKIPMDEVGFQLFSIASAMYGGNYNIEGEGLLIPLVYIKRNAYVYFGSLPDINVRAHHVIYMLGIIAPRISYMDSLLLKKECAKVSACIRNQQEWSMKDFYDVVRRIFENT